MGGAMMSVIMLAEGINSFTAVRIKYLLLIGTQRVCPIDFKSGPSMMIPSIKLEPVTNPSATSLALGLAMIRAGNRPLLLVSQVEILLEREFQ
eukprot:3266940-Rhodomonas_salina.1